MIVNIMANGIPCLMEVESIVQLDSGPCEVTGDLYFVCDKEYVGIGTYKTQLDIEEIIAKPAKVSMKNR